MLGGGALALSGAGFQHYHSTKENFLLGRLHKLMGDFEISENDFKQFNDHFKSFISVSRYERYHTMVMLEKLTLHGSVDPLKIEQRIDKWDRRLVTQFITSTDYIEKQGNQVSYIGANLPCRNPFADYSLANA